MINNYYLNIMIKTFFKDILNTMWRIKTGFCSPMSWNKFTNLSTLYIERKMSNAINVEDVPNGSAR